MRACVASRTIDVDVITSESITSSSSRRGRSARGRRFYARSLSSARLCVSGCGGSVEICITDIICGRCARPKRRRKRRGQSFAALVRCRPPPSSRLVMQLSFLSRVTIAASLSLRGHKAADYGWWLISSDRCVRLTLWAAHSASILRKPGTRARTAAARSSRANVQLQFSCSRERAACRARFPNVVCNNMMKVRLMLVAALLACSAAFDLVDAGQ